MPTVKQLKIDLDAKGIDYHKDDRKHELESLLVAYDLTRHNDGFVKPSDQVVPASGFTKEPSPSVPEDPPEAPVKQVHLPIFTREPTPVFDVFSDFIDPNADPATQAD